MTVYLRNGQWLFVNGQLATGSGCCCGGCSGNCRKTAGYTPFTPDVECPGAVACECYGSCVKYAHNICGYFYYGSWTFDEDGNPLVHTPWEGNPDYEPASFEQWGNDIAACVEPLPEEAFDPPEGYGPPDAAGTASKPPVEMDCAECIPDESTEYWTCVTICEGQCGNPLP